MNNSLTDSLFGPIDKSYCAYFYYLSIFFYIYFLIIVFLYIFLAFTSRKADWNLFYYMLLACTTNFILYFQNRLLYSMCVGKFA